MVQKARIALPATHNKNCKLESGLAVKELKVKVSIYLRSVVHPVIIMHNCHSVSQAVFQQKEREQFSMKRQNLRKYVGVIKTS